MSDPSFTDRALAADAALWTTAFGHRFARDLPAMDGSAPAFRRYLVYEYALVLEAVDLVARAVAAAATIPEKRWLADALGGLVHAQLAYFDAAFARLGLAPAWPGTLPVGVSACLAAMRRAGVGGDYGEMLAVMFAGEWLYWSWCSAMPAGPAADPEVAGWIALHTDEAFRDHAFWLKARLDAVAGADPDAAPHLAETIASTLRRELAFHDAAFAA